MTRRSSSLMHPLRSDCSTFAILTPLYTWTHIDTCGSVNYRIQEKSPRRSHPHERYTNRDGKRDRTGISEGDFSELSSPSKFAFLQNVSILRAHFLLINFFPVKTALQARPGTVLQINGELLLVVKHEMRRGGRGATNVMMRLKNLIQGNTSDRVMDSEEKLDDVSLDRAKAEFLYASGDTFAFMNQDTYETVELHADDVGDNALYLTEGLIVDLQTYEGKFIGLLLPLRVTLKVIEADPSVAGNTADGKVDKVVKLETGLELRVPGFVNQDESIVINTETGEYLERAK